MIQDGKWLGIGNTIMKRSTLIHRKKDSTEKHDSAIMQEPEEGSCRPSLQVVMPQKLQQAKLAMEEEDSDNMSEDENNDWLNYKLNHEEFKAALGLKVKDEDSQALEERQHNHVLAFIFGTTEEIDESTIVKPGATIIESTMQPEPIEVDPEKEALGNQAIETKEETALQKIMPINMVYILPAFYISIEG
ncbi:hypothetical protein L3X38_024287 [Prunus dulcis]|uniref:Uncharacterized protein n=1 Tax=Prunus dulcis TaxID=3755 RepID=A0AAD4VZI6_PRUDU|nr:hypothetical protein L3X38_024287 [Prunus dulcis]